MRIRAETRTKHTKQTAKGCILLEVGDLAKYWDAVSTCLVECRSGCCCERVRRKPRGALSTLGMVEEILFAFLHLLVQAFLVRSQPQETFEFRARLLEGAVRAKRNGEASRQLVIKETTRASIIRER